MRKLTKDLYDTLGRWQSTPHKTELSSLIVDDFDDEQIWQQLELRNSRLVKECIASVSRVATRSALTFGVQLERPKPPTADTSAADDDVHEDIDLGTDASDDLSHASDEEEPQQDFSEKSSATATATSKPTSVVDDAFFRLADMEAFADEQDKPRQASSDSEDDIDYFGDLPSDGDDADEKGGQEARYQDFFDPPPSSGDAKSQAKTQNSTTA